MIQIPIIFAGVLLALLFAGFRVLKEYERGVIFRLGRFAGVRTAGLKWIIPGVDRMVRIGLVTERRLSDRQNMIISTSTTAK